MTRERRQERRAPAFTKGLQMRAPEDFNEATTLCDFIACAVMRITKRILFDCAHTAQPAKMLQVTSVPPNLLRVQ